MNIQEEKDSLNTIRQMIIKLFTKANIDNFVFYFSYNDNFVGATQGHLIFHSDCMKHISELIYNTLIEKISDFETEGEA